MNIDRRRALALIVAIPAALIASPVLAARPLVYQNSSKVAVNGYDVVAYFKQGKPVEGAEQFTVRHAGAVFRFASAEHRDLFAADPT